MSEKLHEQLDRGSNAQIAKESLKEAFDALEKQCFEAFRHSDVHDDAGHQTCRIYLKVLEDVKQRFNAAIGNGKAAQKELIRIKKPSKIRNIING